MGSPKMFNWRTGKTKVTRYVRLSEAYPMSTLLMRAGYRPTYEMLIREGWYHTAARLYPQVMELPLPIEEETKS